MAIYRFNVKFEDFDYVSRDIEIKAIQTFEQLHKAVNDAIGFDGKHPASFFLSDEHWIKGQEISNKIEKKEGKIVPMKNSRMIDFINDPHQKIYFIIESNPFWEFQIELTKITHLESKTEYPRCIKSVGEAPKQYGVTKLGLPKTEFDFLGEDKYEEAEFDADAAEDADPLSADKSEPVAEELAEGGEINLEEESFEDPENEA